MPHFIAKFTAKANQFDSVLGILQGFVPVANSEPGCLVYKIIETNAEQGDIYLEEHWQDDDTFEQHVALDYVQHFLNVQSKELLDGGLNAMTPEEYHNQ